MKQYLNDFLYEVEAWHVTSYRMQLDAENTRAISDVPLYPSHLLQYLFFCPLHSLKSRSKRHSSERI